MNKDYFDEPCVECGDKLYNNEARDVCSSCNQFIHPSCHDSHYSRGHKPQKLGYVSLSPESILQLNKEKQQ